MHNTDFQIRPMEKEDLPAAMYIINQEGWNQTLYDWELL